MLQREQQRLFPHKVIFALSVFVFCFSFLFLVHLLHSIHLSVCLFDVYDRCIVGIFTGPVLLTDDDVLSFISFSQSFIGYFFVDVVGKAFVHCLFCYFCSDVMLMFLAKCTDRQTDASFHVFLRVQSPNVWKLLSSTE